MRRRHFLCRGLKRGINPGKVLQFVADTDQLIRYRGFRVVKQFKQRGRGFVQPLCVLQDATLAFQLLLLAWLRLNGVNLLDLERQQFVLLLQLTLALEHGISPGHNVRYRIIML